MKYFNNPQIMKTWISCVCIFVTCALVYGAPSVEEIHNKCQSDPATYLDDLTFIAIYAGELFDRTQAGAHMLCMSTRLGIQNLDGTINREAVRELLAVNITDKTELNNVTDKCMEQGSSPDETALILNQCITENTRERRHGRHRGHHHEHHHRHHHDHHGSSPCHPLS